MLDIDRRSFLAGVSVSTLPVPALALRQIKAPLRDVSRLLEGRLGLSEATATAMAARARRFTGGFTAILVGSSDGKAVKFNHDLDRQGHWLLRGLANYDWLLADATAFACDRAQAQLYGSGASFRWFSGCSFGSATAHLFRGNKSALFLVTRAAQAAQPRRLDVVMV